MELVLCASRTCLCSQLETGMKECQICKICFAYGDENLSVGWWSCSVILSPKMEKLHQCCVYKQFECKKHFTLGALLHMQFCLHIVLGLSSFGKGENLLKDESSIKLWLRCLSFLSLFFMLRRKKWTRILTRPTKLVFVLSSPHSIASWFSEPFNFRLDPPIKANETQWESARFWWLEQPDPLDHSSPRRVLS
jgi:hypothetical protein